MVQRILALRVNCKGCGVSFAPVTKRQKYHNEDCREDYYKEHYFPQVHVDKTCPNCGDVFSSTMPKKQTYCTLECREDAREKRLDALKAGKDTEKITHLRERIGAFEQDEFKCTVCGRGPKDGAVLDVVDEGAKLKTVCIECKIGGN